MRIPARWDPAGITQLIVQRSPPGHACFLREADYHRYLAELREAAARFACAVHAYVLMPNHVHLLVTPRIEGNLERLMQSLGRRYARYLNDTLNCISAVWERGYRASFVDNERYVVMCYRYIELNPVRAGLVPSAQDYRWSSYAGNALGYEQALLSPHPSYCAIAREPEDRRAVYRSLVSQGLDHRMLEAIRCALQRQKALGSDHFQRAVERQWSPGFAPGVREWTMSYMPAMAC